jgi:hypothetical protein
MKHQLVGCSEKVKRARENIKNLATEIRRCLEDKDYRKVTKFDENFELSSVTVFGPPVPAHISVLIGEIAHHLRSSLDHLVWALVLENKKKGTPKTEFPIFRTKPEGKEPIAAFERKIELIRSDCAQAIRDLQPYNRTIPTDDPLWLVFELDRIDKHRLLVSTVAQAHVYHMGDAEGFARRLVNSRPLGAPNSDVQIGGTFSIEVAIEDAPNSQFKAAVPLLAYLTTYVEAVIRLFEPAFANVASEPSELVRIATFTGHRPPPSPEKGS